MTVRIACAASVIALVSACSQQPGPSSLSATDLAFEAYRAGNFVAAEQGYSGVLSANPNDVTAMLGLAEVYEQTGRVGEALDLYRRVDAARSGAIRVWNDGRIMQDGVTEVAVYRLGELGEPTVSRIGRAAPGASYGSDSSGIAVPTMPISGGQTPYYETAPSYTAPEPTIYAPAGFGASSTTPTYSDSPSYALDDNGIVYDADPVAMQPFNGSVYGTPEPAVIATPAYASPAPIQYQQAPAQPATYAPAPTYTPVPTYAPAPATPAPRYAPIPQRTTVAPAPPPTLPSGIQQPGYTVVNGNFVYISAEDIAAGRVAPAAPAPQTYGTPVTTPTPYRAPAPYQGPIGGDVMNGIPIQNLN